MAEHDLTGGGHDTSWRDKAAKKRSEAYAKIPHEWRLSPEYLTGNEHSDTDVMDIPALCGILSSQELDITEKFNAVALGQAVQSGAISAAAVALAFSKRAAIAQQLINCLTETFFDEAIQRGEYLDKYLAENGRPVGPLHGIPISLKDPFNYVGAASTIGLIAYLDRPVAQENSPLVDILLELGAILYCKTNVPQTMMTADSDNNIFGRTLNPRKLSLGAGGSSGGEGALIAMRGSVLGVGTDIAGSIRIPAICNGTYGFKPSSNRIPYGGQAYCSRRGSPGYPACAGPLANSFEDLPLLIQSVIDAKPWDKDASAIPFPWRSVVAEVSPGCLRVGYFLQDPDYKIHPPVIRALETAAKKLSNAGLEIVLLPNVPSVKRGWQLAIDALSLDNSQASLEVVRAGKEPFIPSLEVDDNPIKKPDVKSIDDVWDMNVARAEYKEQWRRAFVHHRLDVVMCAPAQHTAVLHDRYGMPPYTAVFNLLEVSNVRELLNHC